MFGLDEKVGGEIYGFLLYSVQHLKLITLILLPMKKWKGSRYQATYSILT